MADLSAQRSFSRRSLVLSMLFGVLFATAYSVGTWLDHTLSGGFQAVELWVLLFLLSGLCFFAMADFLPKRLQGRREHALPGKTVFWLSFGLLMLLWLPYWLALWPGLLNYDSSAQLQQALSHHYSKLHPLLDTLLIGAWYRLGGEALGSYNAGLAVAEALKLTSAAACLAWVIHWACGRFSLGWVGFSLLTLFFGAFPAVPLMVLSMTKDSPLGLLCLAQGVLLLKLAQAPEKKGRLLWLILITVLMMLFRSSMLLVFFVTIVVALLMLNKRDGERGALKRLLLPYGAGATALFLLLSGVLSSATNAQPGHMKEFLSVPTQQLCRVWDQHKVTMDRDVKAEIESVIPKFGLQSYKPQNVDASKSALLWIYNGETLGRFLKVWADVLPLYPKEYVVAFLYSTAGYWYLDDLSYTDAYGTNRNMGLFQLNISLDCGLTNDSQWPTLEDWIRNSFCLNGFLQWPALRYLFSPALYNWLLLAAVMILILRREKIRLLCTSLFATYALGLLFTPVCLFRYEWPIVLMAPILVLWMLFPESSINKRRPILALLHSAQPDPL